MRHAGVADPRAGAAPRPREGGLLVTTSNFGKYYHGNLIERAQALVFALTGNFGKKGSGFVAFPFMSADGLEGYVRDMFSLGRHDEHDRREDHRQDRRWTPPA